MWKNSQEFQIAELCRAEARNFGHAVKNLEIYNILPSFHDASMQLCEVTAKSLRTHCELFGICWELCMNFAILENGSMRDRECAMCYWELLATTYESLEIHSNGRWISWDSAAKSEDPLRVCWEWIVDQILFHINSCFQIQISFIHIFSTEHIEYLGGNGKPFTETQTFAADSWGSERCLVGRHTLSQNYYWEAEKAWTKGPKVLDQTLAVQAARLWAL